MSAEPDDERLDPDSLAKSQLDRDLLARPFRAAVLSPRAWWRHLLFVVAAIAAGATALAFNYADRAAFRFTAFLMGNETLYGVSVPDELSWALPSIALMVGIPVVMRMRDLFFPGTQGTGIPQVIASLKVEDGPIREHMLSWRIALGKALLLVIGLFSGATIGREGPSVHVGACLMYLSARYAQYPTWLIQRGLILGGGGAGIAAAFNAPFAGIIFTFEEIGRAFNKESASAVVRAVAIACIVCLVFLGNYLFYGHVEADLEGIRQWLVVIPVAFVGGTLGGLFASAVVWATPRVSASVKRRPWLTGLALGGGLALAGLLSGGLSYGSGFPEAQDILVHGKEYPWHYPLLKAVSSFLSLVSGIPGGLFDPSLSVGASLGQLAHPLFPHMEPSSLILLFMVSYFGGVVQSPITAAVILLEMTDARGMTLPLLLCSVLAYEASHLVCRESIYEALAALFLADIQKPPPS